MALRHTLVMICLSLAVTAAWGCKRRQDEPASTTTRGALPPPAPSPAPAPPAPPEPEPVPEPQVARPRPPPAPPPPIEEPVDERPHWQQVLDSQEPGALTGRRRTEPSKSAASAPAPQPGPTEQPAGEAAKTPPAPAPTGKGKTYCTWQYYSKIHYTCTDQEPSAAKENCEKTQSAALGEPVICVCVPAEGYAPQCM